MPTCMRTGCAEPAIRMWQRHATAEERAALDPPVPEEEPALLPIYACQTDKISLALAAGVHESTCTAPPTCNCVPTYGPVTPQAVE